MKFVMWSVLAAITTVLLASPSHGQKGSPSADGIDPILSQFWKLWDEQSPNAAISSLATPGREARVQAMADQVSGAITRMGTYLGREEISRVHIGSRLVLVRYLLRFEKQPLFLDLTYYRADTRWTNYGFDFQDDEKKFFMEMSRINDAPQNVADAR